MSGTAMVAEIVGILTSGITGIASGIGTGLSTLVSSIFLQTVGETTSLSTFGIVVIVFAGVSLAIGLSRFVVGLISTMGARK